MRLGVRGTAQRGKTLVDGALALPKSSHSHPVRGAFRARLIQRSASSRRGPGSFTITIRRPDETFAPPFRKGRHYVGRRENRLPRHC